MTSLRHAVNKILFMDRDAIHSPGFGDSVVLRTLDTNAVDGNSHSDPDSGEAPPRAAGKVHCLELELSFPEFGAGRSINTNDDGATGTGTTSDTGSTTVDKDSTVGDKKAYKIALATDFVHPDTEKKLKTLGLWENGDMGTAQCLPVLLRTRTYAAHVDSRS